MPKNNPQAPEEKDRVVGADEKPRPSAAERAGMEPRAKAEADPTRSEAEKRAPGSEVAGRFGPIRHPEQNPPLNNPDSPYADPLTDEEKERLGKTEGPTGARNPDGSPGPQTQDWRGRQGEGQGGGDTGSREGE